MKKYILKKDLPWMKAETIFWFENENMKIKGSTLLASCYETTKDYFFTNDDGNFDESDFEDCGWIEKVKPREFFVRVSGKTPISVCEDIEPLKSSGDYEIIKVREVLE